MFRMEKIENIVGAKIYVYTFCYNEINMIPYAMQYWERFASKVIVYDNGSTDGSLELLAEYPELIEIRHFTYENGIDDFKLQHMKNNIWKDARFEADYVVVCDMDEFIYCDDFCSFIDNIKKNDITIVKPIGMNLFSFYFPNFNEEELMHQIVNRGAYSEKESKCVFFDPLKIEEINYDPGAHACHPEGNVKWYNEKDFYLYHAKYISLDYIQSRYKLSGGRLSDINKDKGFGIEYLQKDEETTKEFMGVYLDSFFLNGTKISSAYEVIEWDGKSKLTIPSVELPKSRKCIIVIPIYSSKLSKDEKISLKQVVRLLGEKYHICLVAPFGLNLTEYYNVADGFLFSVMRCSEEYFKSVRTYNVLCSRWEFYDWFKYYDYMLIYQLDAFVFYDKLEYFCDLGYDYIGAPQLIPNYTVGNGGFSLRKINKMVDICKKYPFDPSIFEDCFISKFLTFELNIAPVNVGFEFSIQQEKKKNLYNLGKLPFGCHYFKWDNFWEHNYDCSDLYEDDYILGEETIEVKPLALMTSEELENTFNEKENNNVDSIDNVEKIKN